MQVLGLGAQLADFIRRISPFQRGQVDHAENEIESRPFAVALDAPGREPRGPFRDSHLIDGWRSGNIIADRSG